MIWNLKVLLDIIIATVLGCLIGGTILLAIAAKNNLGSQEGIELVSVLAKMVGAVAILHLPFSVIFALWFTVPTGYIMAGLEKDGYPQSLLRHIAVPVGVAASIGLLVLVSILKQQYELDTVSFSSDREAKMHRINMSGTYVVGVFFGAHILVQGTCTAALFYLLRRWRSRKNRTDNGAPSSPNPRRQVPRNPPKAWFGQDPWS